MPEFNNKKFEFLADNIPEIIWTAQPDGKVDYFNQNWYDYSGLTFEQTKDWGWQLAIHPGDLQNIVAVWTKSIQTGKPYEFEYRFLKKDNLGYRWHLGRAIPMKDGDGNIVKWFGTSTDIHAQKTLEEKLKFTNEELVFLNESIIKSTDCTIITTDTTGLIKSFNNAAEKKLGYKTEEIIEKNSILDLYLESELIATSNKLSKELKKVIQPGFEAITIKSILGLNNRVEFTYVGKDGIMFPVYLSTTALKNKTGEITGFLFIGIDISEKKTSEKKLQQTEQFNRLVTNSLPNIIFIFDLVEKQYVYFNKQLETFTGLSEHEIKTNGYKLLPSIIHSDDLPLVRTRQENFKLLKDDEVNEIEFRLKNAVGEYRWMSARGIVFKRGKNGEAVQYISTAQDITENKLLQVKLKNREVLLEESQSMANIGSFERNLTTDEGIWTKELYKIFDLPENHPIASDFIGQLIHPEDQPMVLKVMKEAGFSGAFNFKARIITVKGVEKWLESKGKLFFENNVPVRMIGTIMDITKSKQIEMELSKSKELAENASAYKSRFLANMSHEIRTPLNAILGFSQILKKLCKDDEQLQYLNHITSAGDLLGRLIGDILDLSKIEEGKLEIHYENFDLKEVIKSTVYPYKFKANENGIDFHVSFDGFLPDYFIGDPLRIKQILINLIGNALKFTEKGSIHLDIKSISQNGEHVTLLFSLTDTGIGIPFDKQKKIFDSFVQADYSIERKFGGTGLGLSIVKQLLHHMGGDIKIESPINKNSIDNPGTKFTFTLQLKLGHIPTDNLSKKQNYELLKFEHPFRILVAEDNELNQRLAEVMLKEMGCIPILASNGEDAIEKFQEDAFSLILMDINMPGMDGYTASRILRQKYKTTIPIIGLTANVYKEDINHCVEAGMNDHIGKPYHPEQLYNKIKKYLIQPPFLVEKNRNSFSAIEFLKDFSNGDPDYIKELVDVYIKQKDESIEKLKIYYEEQNYKGLQDLIHKLKSSVGFFKLNELKDQLQNLENDFKNKRNIEAIPSIIDQIQIQSEEMTQEVLKEVERMKTSNG